MTHRESESLWDKLHVLLQGRTLLHLCSSDSALWDIHCLLLHLDLDLNLIWTLGTQFVIPNSLWDVIADYFWVVIIVIRLVWVWTESALIKAEWIAWSPVLTHCYSLVPVSPVRLVAVQVAWRFQFLRPRQMPWVGTAGWLIGKAMSWNMLTMSMDRIYGS